MGAIRGSTEDKVFVIDHCNYTAIWHPVPCPWYSDNHGMSVPSASPTHGFRG